MPNRSWVSTSRCGRHSRAATTFPPALVQLAGRHRVFLVQLKKVSARHELAALFADARVIKTGVAVNGDIEKLHEVMRFDPAGFVDLGKLAARKGIKASGVRTLAAQLLGLRISKGAQCSNWERSELAPAQVVYAATDAWICREIYLCLDKMADAGKKRDLHVPRKAIGSAPGTGGSHDQNNHPRPG